MVIVCTEVKAMNNGITRWDKAWLPLVVAGGGVLGYYGYVSPEGVSFINESAPVLLAMGAQAALVLWRKNKA